MPRNPNLMYVGNRPCFIKGNHIAFEKLVNMEGRKLHVKILQAILCNATHGSISMGKKKKKYRNKIKEKNNKTTTRTKGQNLMLYRIAHPTYAWLSYKQEARGRWWPCNAHLSIITLRVPDLDISRQTFRPRFMMIMLTSKTM